MKITTWLDRITDESNLWLSAVQAEDSGDTGRAAALYLEDASVSLEAGAAPRAALSCSCAARCLLSVGALQDSRTLYFEAGVTYSEIAASRFANSIREALWALQRAYLCFLMAGDVGESERAKREFESLVRRADPFEGGSWFELPKVPAPNPGLPGGAPVPESVRSEMDRFIMLRRTRKAETGPAWDARRAREGGEALDQESFAGKLG